MFGNTFKKTYSHVDPDDPIPEIEIGIFNFVSNQITKDNFTIDSGSSITCINERIFDILDLQYHRTVSIQYADGTEMDQYTCLVDLELPQINFKELKLSYTTSTRCRKLAWPRYIKQVIFVSVWTKANV
ncbi:hypothetical protein IH785_00515 [candidate division KSB1 bacterium]|nr:hypothetical protein [candidate division KSB1 bacterium]